MLPSRTNIRIRRPRHHIHFISMRVYYWRHFACYSFMLTLLVVHVVFQYTVGPPSSSVGLSNDWAPGEGRHVPFTDLALACEQWIGRRSLKVPKSFMDQEPSDVFPRGSHSTNFDNNAERAKVGAYQDGVLSMTQGPRGPWIPLTQTSMGDDGKASMDQSKYNDKSIDQSKDSIRKVLKVPQGNVMIKDHDTRLQFQTADSENVMRQLRASNSSKSVLEKHGRQETSSSPLVVMETIKSQVIQWTGQHAEEATHNGHLPQVGRQGKGAGGGKGGGGLEAIEGYDHKEHAISPSILQAGKTDHSGKNSGSTHNGALREPVSPNNDVSIEKKVHDDSRWRGDVNPSFHPLPAPFSHTDRESDNLHHLRYSFTCTNINQISIKRKLGQGVTKQVYLGIHQGHKVAVKMVTRNVIDVSSCIKKLHHDTSVDPSLLWAEKHKCYTLPNMKLMKEILLLNQLNHPNLLQLKGYCVRSEETDSTSLQEHGIVAVYEYGLRFYVSNLRDWPWQVKMTTAMQLADLLDYLQHSPLGSLRISDFKDAHFLLADGRIKLTDLDDVTSLEPHCKPDTGPEFDLKGQRRTRGDICGFNLKCTAGLCPGYNALKNLDNFNRLFFSNLLVSDDVQIEEQMINIRNRLDSLSISADELKKILSHYLNAPTKPAQL